MNLTQRVLTIEARHFAPAEWLPALVCGTAAALAFLTLGETPLVRAAALGLVVALLALSLSRWGAALAVVGGLAFAFSPAFWSQTSGAVTPGFGSVALAVGLASAVALGIAWFGKRPTLAFAVGAVVFSALFWQFIGTPRSLRLTTVLTAGLIFLLLDALLLTNPRPDEAEPARLGWPHTVGVLLLVGAGVLNDPMFTLLIPAVTLTLLLSRTPLSRWYWAVLVLIAIVGARGLMLQYLDSDWLWRSAAQLEAADVRVPFVIADGWRDPARWLNLFGLVIDQFTPLGVALGLFGLARLARWYPPLGVVTMVAYASYALFGLVYFGRDSAVLLLPLLMIQTLWMTYAIHGFGKWLERISPPLVRWIVPGVFTLLPLLMLLRIVRGV
jgi:hypothetical protein